MWLRSATSRLGDVPPHRNQRAAAGADLAAQDNATVRRTDPIRGGRLALGIHGVHIRALAHSLHSEIYMSQPSVASPTAPAAATPSSGLPATRSSYGSTAVCLLVGIILVIAGLYNLVLNPSGDNPLSGGAVNLQALFMGMTFFISGCIFLAAVWRPRP